MPSQSCLVSSLQQPWAVDDDWMLYLDLKCPQRLIYPRLGSPPMALLGSSDTFRRPAFEIGNCCWRRESSSRTVLAPLPFLPLFLRLSSVNRSAFSATCSHHDAHGPQAARSSRRALKPQPKQMLAPELIISGVGHGQRKPRHCLSSIFRPRIFLGLYTEDMNSKALVGTP